MRNRLFGFIRGMFGPFLYIAILSLFMVTGVNNTLVASAIQNLSQTTIGDPQLDKAAFAQKTKKLQIPFIANNGQVDDRVKFYANTFGGTVFVTKEGVIVYALPNNSSEVETQCLASSMHSRNGRHNAEARIQDNSGSCIVDCASVENRTSDIVHSVSCIVDQDSKSEFQNPKSGVALREEFVGSRIKTIHGEDPSVTNVNYFKGNNPEKWKTDVSTYDFVNLGEIYKGIELKLKAYGDNVEKLFCVKPGASPDQIQVQINGGKSLKINDEGQLVAETEVGPVKFTKPVAYQEINGKRVDVSVEYRVESSEAENKSSKRKTCNSRFMSINPKSAIQNLSPTSTGDTQSEYGFKVASYDRTKDLIIDPLLASTFLGGAGDGYGRYITLDTSGNVYVAGHTKSTDFPTTSGVYDTSSTDGYYGDVFVSKLDGGLTTLQASTYLGGSSTDWGLSLALDTSGNVYVTGYTSSTDFPTTSGAYDTTFNGVTDAFVSKLNSGLTSLIASTFLGGSGDAYGYSLALDTSGNVYVMGETASTDFPTTSGAYDTSYNGAYDAFVSKLNSELTSLLASTYLGGSLSDGSHSLALDTSGNVYVTGWTVSSNFPTTSGAYDTSYNGGVGSGGDVFVSKLDGGLTSLQASTYLGGSDNDYGGKKSLTLDTSGNVYVAGHTKSTNFPTTSGAYDTSYNGDYDAFISKLNSGLTSLLASTYLGGSSTEWGPSLALDTSGNVYVTGETTSTNFQTTSGAYDISFNGSSDAFVSKLNSGLTSLLASTYMGGPGDDIGYSLTLDTSGNVYVTGIAGSGFPVTSGAYDISYNGGSYDVFVSKLDSNLSATPSDTTAPSGSISINSGASYTNSSTVTLTLSATDSTGVTGYYLSDSSTTPSASASGWTSVTSTTSYSGSVSYSLSGGEGGKTIYAWYKDVAGNVSSTANATITLDTTVPTVTISSPTSSSTYTSTSSTISLGGSASDSSSGISSVAWSNNRGGNGTATGTASWMVSSISLSTGDNVITVTAKDGANNSGTDTLQVTYGTATTVSVPIVSTGSASSVTTSSATLNGTVNANSGTTTAWFQYGTTSGSYGNTSSTQTVTGSSNTTVSIGISGLSSGTNYYYRIAAQNSAGTSYGSESSVTTTSAATPTPTPSTGDTTAPTVTITSPTSSSTYTTTSSTITLSGTASDNSGSVSTVTWSNSKGGSGTASGTTSWTISSISLSSGDNVITVTATDGSGNSGTDTITVTYNVTSAPTPTAVPTATTTPKPSPTAQPTPTRPPTLPPLPTPLVSPSPSGEGIVFGFVNDEDELPLKGVTVTIVGANGRSPIQNSTETDENGYYEFSGLSKGNYTLTYEKEGFLDQIQDISLEEGELKDLGTVTMEQSVSGKIYGYVVNIKGDPIEFVRLKLRGIKTKVTKNASTDADGFFEFADLEADTYVIVAKKKRYRNTQQKITLEEGASEEIEIVMKKTSKRIKGLLLEEDVQ